MEPTFQSVRHGHNSMEMVCFHTELTLPHFLAWDTAWWLELMTEIKQI